MPRESSWFVALVGTSIALLFGFLCGVITRRNDRRYRQREKEARAQERRAAARFTAIVTRNPESLLLLDVAGKICYANEMDVKFLGSSQETLAGQRLLDWLHPDDAPWFDEHFLKSQEVRVGGIAPRFRRHDDTWCPFDITRHDCRRDPDVAGTVIVLHDLSESTWAETRLRRQMDLYEALLRAQGETGEGFLIITERSAAIRYANNAFAEICGYHPGELYTLPSLALLFVSEERANLYEHLVQLTATGSNSRRFETVLRHKAGHRVELEVAVAPLLAEERADDRGLGRDQFILIARDITARRRAERDLRAADRRYRNLVENAGDIIYSHSLDGLLTDINGAAVRLLGYTREELLGQPLRQFLDHRALAKARTQVTDLLATSQEASPYELELICKDGSRLTVEANARLIYDGDRPIGVEGIARDLSARKAYERQQADRRFRALVQHASDVILILDTQGQITYASPSIASIWGYGAEELLVAPIDTLIHPADSVRASTFFDAMHSTPGQARSLQARLRHIDGSWRYIEALATNLLTDPDVQGIVLNCRDVTERAAAEEALRESELKIRTVATNAPIVLFALDADGIFTLSEGKGLQALGLESGVIVGQSIFEVYRHVPALLDAARRALAGEAFRAVIDIGPLTFDVSFAPDHSRPGMPGGIIGVATNITERRAVEQQLSHQAFHDALTDLPNRALFMDRLGQALARTARERANCAVLFLDLDRFKVVNDSLGHEVGDQLLIAVGQRVRSCLRPGDTLARLGGDEFTILLEALSDRQESIVVAERLTTAMTRPFHISLREREHEIYVNTSIGIVPAIGGASAFDMSPADILRDADIAMYQAKAAGKGRYVIFDQQMNAAADARLTLETELRRAIELGEFVVHYQPTIDLSTGRVRGVEALTRWQHPTRGLIPPSDFIPLAEEMGAIIPLGRWTLGEACQQLRHWQRRFLQEAPQTVSVNLSAREFQSPDLVAQIAAILHTSGLPPAALRLEITESVVMTETLAANDTLAALKELGVSLVIDDFGTGYSSLGYLKRLPVDMLKIDRSFITEIERDPENTAIVRAVITMAQTLGLGVTAEGVETIEQMDCLRDLGCDLGQGYLFCRPTPPDTLAPLFIHGYASLRKFDRRAITA